MDANASWQATLFSVSVIACLAACIASGPIAAGLLGIGVALAAIGVSSPSGDCDYGQEETSPKACVIVACNEPVPDAEFGLQATPEKRWTDSVRAADQAGIRSR